MPLLGNSQHNAYWGKTDKNYNVWRILNSTLTNAIVNALAMPTVRTQNESIPFPNQRRYFGRSPSQGYWFSPPPVYSRTPTKSWGQNYFG